MRTFLELYIFYLFFSYQISVCDCDSQGSIGVSCDNEGKCMCKPNFMGTRCDKCKEGLYNFPICEGILLLFIIINKFHNIFLL
jgi:hypothetical protein